MKIVFILSLALLMIFAISCEKQKSDDLNYQTMDKELFKKSVSFTDARLRSLNELEYVRELVLTDFSKSNQMPKSVIFDGTTLFDDGSFNDVKANDGIYTSAAKFNHSEKSPYNSDLTINSIMELSIIDKEFKYLDELNKFLTSGYSKSHLSNVAIGNRGPVATIECDVEFGTCGCRADRWGLCDCCCVTVSNCRAKVGWE